ncbi:MAG: YidC/Oxa1 family rane protein insertase [Gaiellaceae bacterium]|jgi:YidC/Oxa1 family membrane protein insertase|nr:YidC/Oxa1 family rane protein insertase [Gaiellaceae bacterium]
MLVASPLTPLEHLLRHILNGIHSVGLPWSWSIIALTIIVRMLLVPLTVKQIHSMQNMQAHAPQMKEIQRKYKGDRQKLNEELMKFYKENNINPASSCLPLLAQLPIFIGLFYTLRHFAKHPPGGQAAIDRGAFSWLHFVPDITKHANSHWSGFVLLAIYVLSQVASTYFMSGTMQKSQRYLMMILPFVFIPFILRFPTGLVLYWMTTNLWTVGQGLITRRLMPKVAPPTTQKRSSRTPAKTSDDDGAQPEAEAAAPKPAAGPPRRVKRKKKARR